VFLNQVISFLIVAWAVFLLIKAMNRLQNRQAEEPPAPAEPPEDVKLLREIRDALTR
jgi:large conductance mechanosensitive channel